MKQILKKTNWFGLAQVLFVFALVLSPIAFSSFAQAGTLPEPKGLCETGLNCTKVTLNQLIIKVIRWILAITLAVDVLFMIIGGFLYITSAGNEERAKKGRTTVINAIIGLVIIILAYVIANVISSFFSAEEIAA